MKKTKLYSIKTLQDKEQVDFISEILKYANVIFKKGTALQKDDVLDLLFDISEEVKNNHNKKNYEFNLIQFPNVDKY